MMTARSLGIHCVGAHPIRRMAGPLISAPSWRQQGTWPVKWHYILFVAISFDVCVTKSIYLLPWHMPRLLLSRWLHYGLCD